MHNLATQQVNESQILTREGLDILEYAGGGGLQDNGNLYDRVKGDENDSPKA